MSQKQEPPLQENLLEFTPRIAIDWEADAEQIFLKVPKFKSALWRKVFSPRLVQPYIRLRLDEYGSYVWQQIDGCRSVYEIALALEEKFGEGVQPVFDRVGLFISMLHRHQFIQLEKNSSTITTGGGRRS